MKATMALGFGNNEEITTVIDDYEYIRNNYVRASLVNYEKNIFAQILENNYGKDAAIKMLEDYKIGTSDKKNGGTIFWWIGIDGKTHWGDTVVLNPHDASVMEHSPIELIHPSGYSCCFFGEHLLKSDNDKPIVVVKREAIAVIGSYVYPEYIWLSTKLERDFKTKYDGRIIRNVRLLDERMLQLVSGRNPQFYPTKGFEKLDKFRFVG